MREYDLYYPMHFNDGRAVPASHLEELKKALRDEFGGLTFFPQKSEGHWKIGKVTFREAIVILRLLCEDAQKAHRYLIPLKARLGKDLDQEEILIVEREVTVL